MKKNLYFAFLFLTAILFAQNSLQSTTNSFKNYPIFYKNNSIVLSQKKLTIIDQDIIRRLDNNWLINPTFSLSDADEISSLTIKKQLEDLNQRTPFELSHNPTLERYIRVFLKNRRESLAKLMDRASYFFPIFETSLDKYNLPLEIKYLAIIESALKPNAISPSGAKGLWQFMLSTGKQYDLQVDSYVDDRYDILKSTEAACKYLRDLHRTFGDWNLALAAYNSGPGNVRKAILRAKGNKNYWEIRRYLPQETQGYLPAFYATYYIFEYAKSLHLQASKSEINYLETDTIHIKKRLSFSNIQKNIPIKNTLLRALNPQYKLEIIPYSKNKTYTLTLPQNMVKYFIENEENIYSSVNSKIKKTNSGRIEITKNNSYIVQLNDNLESIANKNNISLEQLKIWNGLQTDFLIIGQRLVITNKKRSDRTQFYNHNSITNLSKYETYIVQNGDTLFNISRKYTNVTIDQIRKWNYIDNVHFLKPGTKLKIIKI